MTSTPRLRAPSSQAPREDIIPKPSGGPRVAMIQDPAELLYQAYSKALDNKGPRGVALKLWHQLANVERKAWRFAWEETRLLLGTGKRLILPTPKPGELLLVIAGERAYSFTSIERADLKTIATIKKTLAEMDDDVTEKEAELNG